MGTGRATRRPATIGRLGLIMLALLPLAAGVASAQQGKPAAPAPKAQAFPRAPVAPRRADAGAWAGSSPAPAPGPTVVMGGGISTDAGVIESRTLDGGTRIFKFSEIDIEGRLKSPQLVYFLRRVRAEFAAGDLGHRTFMREMSETRKEPSF
jgi:hypothetical protein